MIRALRSWLERRRLLRAARDARALAFAAHRAAVLKLDTKAAHWTRKALYRATHEKLRLELGMSSRDHAQTISGAGR